VLDCGEIGIRFEGIKRFLCLGNFVRGCGTVLGGQPAIHLTGGSTTEGLVEHNHCGSTLGGYGIQEDSAGFNMFLGNDVRDNPLRGTNGSMNVSETNRSFLNLGGEVS
jgi:hypothetical protein